MVSPWCLLCKSFTAEKNLGFAPDLHFGWGSSDIQRFREKTKFAHSFLSATVHYRKRTRKPQGCLGTLVSVDICKWHQLQAVWQARGRINHTGHHKCRTGKKQKTPSDADHLSSGFKGALQVRNVIGIFKSSNKKHLPILHLPHWLHSIFLLIFFSINPVFVLKKKHEQAYKQGRVDWREITTGEFCFSSSEFKKKNKNNFQ